MDELNKLMIKFFEFFRPSHSKTVFYHIDEDRFYLRNPEKQSYSYVEISRWVDTKNSDGLWVKIVCGKGDIILNSTQIINLAKQLKFLEGISNKHFDAEND